MAKMSKDIVPDNFTFALAAMDAVPVILFGVNCMILGKLFQSPLFLLGAVMCFVSGAIKVLWKFLVAGIKKNVWWMFLQMRIVMPLGFVLMLISFVRMMFTGHFGSITGASFSAPVILFFILGVLGMVLMGVFAAKLDSSDLKSNYIEQTTNALSQACFLIGLLMM